jgi:hypothetical protein
METTQLMWVVGGGAVIGVAVVLFFLSRKGRRYQLTKRSVALGLHPESDPSSLQTSGLLESALLKGASARCRNILRGEVRGAEVLVFDYVVKQDGRSHTPDSVAFFRLKDKQLPGFELKPRLSSKDDRGFEFASHPHFNEIYAVTGADESQVRDLFKESVLEYFERAENQSWAVASRGEWLAVTFWPLGDREHILTPKEVMGFVEDAKELCFLFTRQVS